MPIYLCLIKFDGDESSKAELDRCINELLDVYSLYLKTGIPSVKDEVIHNATNIQSVTVDIASIILKHIGLGQLTSYEL